MTDVVARRVTHPERAAFFNELFDVIDRGLRDDWMTWDERVGWLENAWELGRRIAREPATARAGTPVRRDGRREARGRSTDPIRPRRRRRPTDRRNRP